ncbi:hypothetical protein ACU7RR_002455 [Providencia stuartii]|uniref:ASCH domain-containing protein n=1 Tax=Providencia stuartii (strain MRSN 2154) TaxID=1157951 RepID=A0A140NSL6_PROSM|nr:MULTISPECIES: hypothetical protein [Providencia]AFH95911.1 hypothetical protein S70_20645 [Providencia stuartii MRSN 2154]MDE8744796.1 hypothetical protein [Providencia thailandensis]MDE8766015.1 hypothetical protein [Providencia thailandensis]MDE8778250.1 hypothetical protein [Providencia thailandensis]MDE8782506.1 hypothetical protein [Providencia thailandensis]
MSIYINALSILYPAVTNIIEKKKNVEIRSWYPQQIPLYNLLLVENNVYLKNDEDIDMDATAVAIVDVFSINCWTLQDFRNQSDEITLNREWKDNYYMWDIRNVRILNKSFKCYAKKGIYQLEIDKPEMLQYHV